MRRFLLTAALFLLLPGSASAAWQWPVSGEVITPYRNGADPYAAGQHRGIDIGAPTGAVVRAAAGGEVRFAGTAGSSGLTVSVRTDDGFDTSYLHLASVSVREGGRVATGDRLGAVGTTGTRSAAAPHLHFGVRTAGSRHAYHDPLHFLPPPGPARPPAAPPPTTPEPAVAPPAAEPVPGRADPIRAPGRLPAPAPAPARAGRPVAAPRGAPLSVPRPAEVPPLGHAPRPAEGHVGRRAPSPRGARGPAHAPAGSPSRADGVARSPELSRAPSDIRRPVPAAGGLAAASAEGRPAGGAGPNLGWALACAGLLLAAGLLGLSEDGRRSTRRASAALARLIPAKNAGATCRRG